VTKKKEKESAKEYAQKRRMEDDGSEQSGFVICFSMGLAFSFRGGCPNVRLLATQ
jgi:hypothetical protein